MVYGIRFTEERILFAVCSSRLSDNLDWTLQKNALGPSPLYVHTCKASRSELKLFPKFTVDRFYSGFSLDHPSPSKFKHFPHQGIRYFLQCSDKLAWYLTKMTIKLFTELLCLQILSNLYCDDDNLRCAWKYAGKILQTHSVTGCANVFIHIVFNCSGFKLHNYLLISKRLQVWQCILWVLIALEVIQVQPIYFFRFAFKS